MTDETSFGAGVTNGQEPQRGDAARPPRRHRLLRRLLAQVAVAALLATLITAFVARVYMIPSGSMEATLQGCDGCQNDRVLVDKIVYLFRDPHPGEVVVFVAPETWTDVSHETSAARDPLQSIGATLGLAKPTETDLIKRVVAVGGQTVSCCDSENRIIVDGSAIDEPYISFAPEDPLQASFGPVVVPPNELWLMGDNRNNSLDSRAPGHGAVPVQQVIGKARLITSPISRFGNIDDTNPQQPAPSN